MTPEFMLDTAAVRSALRGQGDVAAHLLDHRLSEICISSITLAELRFGADSKESRRLHPLIGTFASSVQVLPFEQAAADRFGAVALELAKRGEPIATSDTPIAALLPVVLAQADVGLAGLQHHAEQDTVLLPPFFNAESERLEEADAPLQVVYREAQRAPVPSAGVQPRVSPLRCGLVERAGQGFNLILPKSIWRSKPLPARTAPTFAWIAIASKCIKTPLLRVFRHMYMLTTTAAHVIIFITTPIFMVF